MKHIPILYSTPMVQAKLTKIKTQTRRISGLDEVNEHSSNWQFMRMIYDETKSCYAALFRHSAMGYKTIKCPYGQPGDILYTRETFRLKTWNYDDGEATIEYKTGEKETHYFDDTDGAAEWIINYVDKLEEAGVLKMAFPNDDEEDYDNMYYEPTGKPRPWKPSIFLPKWATRMFDEVVSIRAERVADISESDAIEEGIQKHIGGYATNFRQPEAKSYLDGYSFSYIEEYKKLWDKINGKPSPIEKKVDGKKEVIGYACYPFDKETALYSPALKRDFDMPASAVKKWRGKPLTVIVNPWVWVIEFKPVDKPAGF